MTSPVDTSVKNFNSTMAGAPVMSGTAGALVALLDAVLVTGFDTKTLTSLVALGGVMTATFSGTHASQADSVVLIAGVSGGPGGYVGANGEQKVIGRPTPTTTTWATALPDGTYTGTITMKMAPVGWEKVFSGTNKAVYRSLDPASTKMLLRVDDSGTQWARVVGYEAMTDVDTGVGPFPTAAQMSGGGYWAKSMVSSAAAAPWALHADSRMFYLTTQYGVPNSSAYQGGVTRFFGDFTTYKPGGDAYGCALNFSPSTAIQLMTDAHAFSSAGSPSNGNAAPRAITGLGSAQLHSISPFVGASTATSGGDGFMGSFPSQVDGSLQLSGRFVSLGGSGARGELPGLYSSPQSLLFNSFSQLDKVPGAGPLSGKTLQAVTSHFANIAMNFSGSSTANCGVGFFDITGPWRA